MNSPDDVEREKVAAWLAAEREGRTEDADALFAGMLALSVPRLEAPPGLSRAVMLAVARRRAPRDLAARRGIRVGVAVAAGLIGVTLAVVPPGVAFDMVAGSAGWVVKLLHGAWSLGSAAAGLALALGYVLAAIGRTSALVVATSGAAAVVSISLALSLVSFLGLRRLLAPREECA